MDTINFSFNWNGKLFCKHVPTIRLKNDAKYKVGQHYNLTLFEKQLGPGVILSIKDFRLADLTEMVARLDTGYSKAEAQKMIITMYSNRVTDWNAQLLSLILIERPEMAVLPLEYWSLNDIENVKFHPAKPVPPQPDLFTKA